MSPRVTLRFENTSDPPQYLYSLYFFPPFLFPPSPFVATLTLLFHRAQGARSPWALIFHEARPKETDLSRVSPSYIHRSRGKGIRAAETCDAVRHPSSDITSFRLLHRIDQPHHRFPTVDFQPSLSSRDYRLLREHSSARFVNTLLGRGARIEVMGGEVGEGEVGGDEARWDEVTNNIELTLVGGFEI